MTNTLSYESKKWLKQFNITKNFKIFNYIKINKLFRLRATKYLQNDINRFQKSYIINTLSN